MGNILSELIKHNLNQQHHVKRLNDDGNNHKKNQNSTEGSDSNNVFKKFVRGVLVGARHQMRESIGNNNRDKFKSIDSSPTNNPNHDAFTRRVTLLWGMNNIEEHNKKIEWIIANEQALKGSEGLNNLGFEYRPYSTNDNSINDDSIFFEPQPTSLRDSESNDNIKQVKKIDEIPEMDSTTVSESIPVSSIENSQEASSITSSCTSVSVNSPLIDSLSRFNTESIEEMKDVDEEILTSPYHENAHHLNYENRCTRLYHISSKTFIDEKNRKSFIADGDMYEIIARLCQEVAHERMIQEGNLEWITIISPNNDDKDGNSHHDKSLEPIRALVSKSCSGDEQKSNTKTLIIVTGKGKVRAGIFSRQHLITTGMEESTAISHIHEAIKRNMNVIIIDPNARGDREGMFTFEKSFQHLFGTNDTDLNSIPKLNNQTPIYILAHSQSGAQLVRHLHNQLKQVQPQTLQTKPPKALIACLNQIYSIAFTDSTHNIQWVKQNNNLSTFLQSKCCVYYKSSNPRYDDDWQKHKAGDEVYPSATTNVDPFWEHRFGKIKTFWAGTKEHSLSNWVARNCIWNHFDSCIENPHQSN